jgi:hypothetical protein
MRQLWDFLDNELTSERMLAIEAHLVMCSRCHPHAEFERAFLHAVSLATRHAPLQVPDMGHRVREALRAEGFALP